jgi:hypothetical protein
MTGIRPSLIAASRRRVSFDPDAADYFARIVSAGSSISAANKTAVDAFVKGCKTDGIWSAIKASCLLAGPDDLTGALVPLVGPAPTNVDFASGDYNRTTGLKGNASNKYLSTNRNNDTDPETSKHVSVYVTEDHDRSSAKTYLGMTAASPMTVLLTVNNSGFFSRVNDTSSTNTSIAGPYSGLIGVNRSTLSNVDVRANGIDVNRPSVSGPGASFILEVFRRGSNNQLSDARLSFYSIGESLDLALLDARISTYMASIT